MSTSTLRVIGFVLVVLGFAIGLLPLWVGIQYLGAGWPAIHIEVNGFQLLDVAKRPDGIVEASISSVIWFVPALGELMLTAAWLKGKDRTTRAMKLIA